MNQTIGIENLQIILINDASTDDTLEKLKEWEQRYPDSILIITYDENIRQGGARNRGLEYADGEYIGFVDSDDFVEKDMYKTLYDIAKETDYDVVRCKFVRDEEGKDITLDKLVRRDVLYEFEKRGDFYFHDVKDTGDNGDYGGVWSGIYKRELAIDKGILFPEKLRYEDNYWLEILQLYQKNLYIVDRQLYHYWVNDESTIMKQNSLAIMDKLTIEAMILEEYKRCGAYNCFDDKLFFDFISRAYAGFLYHIFMRFDYIPVDINDLKAFVKACFPDYKERLNVGIDMDMQCEENKILVGTLISDKHYSADEQEQIRYDFLHACAKTKGLI